jgi:hypothetical protein
VSLPPSPWSFHPTATFTSFPARSCWACAAVLPSLACLFICSFVRGCPSPTLRCSGHLALFATCLFCCCLLFSFSFFPGWGSVCPGGYADLAQGCLWEYCMALSSSCGLCLPKQSGSWHLVVQEPSWFLHLSWGGNGMHRLVVWSSQSFASSWWFFL